MTDIVVIGARSVGVDRSSCNTGTSARTARWVAAGRLGAGGAFVHESIIGPLFHGRVMEAAIP